MAPISQVEVAIGDVGQAFVAEVLERLVDEAAGGLAIGGGEFNGVGAVEKRADLLEGLAPMGQ